MMEAAETPNFNPMALQVSPLTTVYLTLQTVAGAADGAETGLDDTGAGIVVGTATGV